ncbi:uncharacterized protein LOC123528768 [Mercenaria mercenaria]|uniref:uncharacterized protein LOC123528768 n=1 Tax=Mercenaria mercenaria TaxID=6596 RepID=UPI001E1D31F9|nr:uncharacterized protein LOC123528768 [Mercenaria mercenaria]
MYKDYLKRNGFVKTDLKLKQNETTNLMERISEENGNKYGGNSGLDTEASVDPLSNEVNTAFSSDLNKRKLILHFDIRNTVLVADSVTNVSVEQALNSFLTGVVWGNESPDGNWVWHSDQLSLTPPAENVVTFYKYLEKKFVKNTTDRTQLRLATGDFSQSDIGKSFQPHFQNHLELLKWRHDFEKDTHNCLTMSGKDGQQYNYIVPALYKCIHHLVESKRDFAIVFRTFGLDAPNVITSLEHGLKGNHPGYQKPVHLKVNRDVGTVKRSDDEPTVFTVIGEDEKTENYVGDRSIYDMLSSSVGISGFRDDVHYWLENSYHHETSKPHIIDPFDQNVHHIFFDDNYRAYEDDSIIDVRLFESRDAKEARSLTKAEVAQFDNVCLVQADLIKCIEDENYYRDRIQECESNYSIFLKRWSRLSRSMSVQVESSK